MVQDPPTCIYRSHGGRGVLCLACACHAATGVWVPVSQLGRWGEQLRLATHADMPRCLLRNLPFPSHSLRRATKKLGSAVAMPAPADFRPPPVHHHVRFPSQHQPPALGMGYLYMPRPHPHPHPPGWFSSVNLHGLELDRSRPRAGTWGRTHGGQPGTVLSRGADSGGGSGPWAAVGHAWPGLLIDLEATTPRLSPQWMEQFGRTMRTCHAITGS